MAGKCKNRWTVTELAAMRNGIAKHGAGKWRIILNDPEFSSVLRHRTNVSLKHKWRSMNGYKPIRKIIKKPSRTPAIFHFDIASEVENLDELISSFNDCKLDDLTDAKQLSASMLKQAIKSHLHEQLRPPNYLKRFLCEKFNEQKPEYDSAGSDRRAKAAVDAEVWRMRVMTPEDAAAAAAAVKMAEAAIPEAEEAEKEAVEAERCAEEKKSIAEELEGKLNEG